MEAKNSLGEKILKSFDALIELLEAQENSLLDEADDFITSKDYKSLEETINKAKSIKEIYEKLEELRKRYINFFPSSGSETGGFEFKSSKRFPKRLERGLRTPEKAFVVPILESLLELGGRGTVSEVLKKVEEKMADTLNEVDYELLPSGNMIRWENTARWCRKKMVVEGLLKKDSPKGIWEISEKGIDFLKNFS